MKKITLVFFFALSCIGQLLAQDSPEFLMLVRDGVKWVNEKVIINNGDTTSYYYSYELDGEILEVDAHNFWYNACYYYTEDGGMGRRDSLIARIGNYWREVKCYKNEAYQRVQQQGRNLIEFYGCSCGVFTMYALYEKGFVGNNENYNFVYYGQDGYYMLCQETLKDRLAPDEILTEENFFLADTIEIEGYQCKRWANVNEDGDTLAYVVEGIGFDSRDMGDLLTPFTRKPDPDADYQEYCGLSHVVKDGQIIYKGMRYRPGIVVGIDEVVAEQSRRPLDENYYDLTGRAVGKDVPTAPGIYIHQGKKICVR